jgi:hypothetical protein
MRMPSLIFLLFRWRYLRLNKLAHGLVESKPFAVISVDIKKQRMVN